ncbi:MAG: hypothetical protein FJY97_00625 [candidate division Zixibacteria bacterium]|nr:hypothetical protein [candidate division Zixibacteria bacterium]
MTSTHLTRPQWLTSSRLLRPGETIRFDFYLPAGCTSGELCIFPRYLEQADPGDAFRPGGSLDWIYALPCERHALSFADGHASWVYRAQTPGNYLARWQAGGETFYRYFAVVEDDHVVLGFSTFIELESEPPLHGLGIPLDYRLPMERFTPTIRCFRNCTAIIGITVIRSCPRCPTRPI